MRWGSPPWNHHHKVLNSTLIGETLHVLYEGEGCYSHATLSSTGEWCEDPIVLGSPATPLGPDTLALVPTPRGARGTPLVVEGVVVIAPECMSFEAGDAPVQDVTLPYSCFDPVSGEFSDGGEDFFDEELVLLGAYQDGWVFALDESHEGVRAVYHCTLGE
ncbi:hypothetical protein KIPB_009389 [Kipferlia bialata]|uniref:Uncharacterized protein n=1 Tax=Kipferlia bialata TaxID=797122 RepID=A0A391NP63_9EUKA|nr:hypothetical protein KIPB_009389 [Kipferlia bialata]|eukprot:g9389.t1